jgi:hypothetical protein
MEGVITALKKEIAMQKQRLHLLEESLERFEQMARGGSKPITTNIFPGQFANKQVSHAISEYVAMAGGSAKITDLPAALSAGDASLGRYPRRTIKLAVLNAPDRLELRDDVVYLKSKKA